MYKTNYTYTHEKTSNTNTSFFVFFGTHRNETCIEPSDPVLKNFGTNTGIVTPLLETWHLRHCISMQTVQPNGLRLWSQELAVLGSCVCWLLSKPAAAAHMQALSSGISSMLSRWAALLPGGISVLFLFSKHQSDNYANNWALQILLSLFSRDALIVFLFGQLFLDAVVLCSGWVFLDLHVFIAFTDWLTTICGAAATSELNQDYCLGFKLCYFWQESIYWN